MQDDEQTCLSCAAGVTTPDIASANASSCRVLLPSYYAATMQQDGEINSTALCIQRHFCVGGEPTAVYDPSQPTQVEGTTVQECPHHSWTQGLNASASSLCSECDLSLVALVCGVCGGRSLHVTSPFKHAAAVLFLLLWVSFKTSA